MRTSILPISLLLLTVLSACSREIPFPKTEGELIILNALLSTDETEHTIYLAISSPQEGNRPLNGAQVRCTVGDGSAIQAREETVRDNSALYHFEASIQPGDRVRIEAEGEGLRAVAQAVAPPAPLPAIVDTLTRNGRMYFTLHVQGRPDQPDYWQLRLSYRWHEQIDYYWREQNPFPEDPDFDFTPGMYIDTYENVSGQELSLDPGEDPILNDGYTPQSVIDRYYNTNAGFLFEFSPVNKTRIFSDHLFTGSGADVRFSTDAEPLRWIDRGGGGDDEWNRRHYHCTRTLTLRLLALDEMAWTYLGAVNRQKNRNGFNYLLVEPVTFPSNVEGGLGFLSVASATPIEIDFPEIDRPDW
ncbi:MAG: DUF4249 family protein [Bacteroidales bacterium]|nr:DUF4249 family protein [Bacteroidales bacterium]MBR1577429.1 DUF4249 family protein [Bacteroidales bacterium]